MKITKYIAGLITVLSTTWLNAQLNFTNNTVGGTNSSVAGGNLSKCVAVTAFIGGGTVNTNVAYGGTIGGGGGNWLTTDWSTVPGGLRAKPRSWGQLAYASGGFNQEQGTAQFGLYVLRGIISGAGNVELALNGNATEHITVPANGSFLFDIDMACRSTTVANGVAGNCFHAKLLVENINGALNLQELANTSLLNHSTNLTATYSVTNSNFKITGTGEANNTVYWVATVRATELVMP